MTKICVKWLFCVLCSLAFTPKAFPSAKAEWPRHRGDAALTGNSGQKVGTSLKLDWIFDAGDFLKSSVVVSGGMAYVGADTGILHALDIETGKEKWHYKTGLGIEAPPLVCDGMVYVGSTDGFLYALDAESGKLRWKYETDGEIMGAANQAMRLKSKDSVIVVGSYDNFVHCVDAKEGKVIWKFETQNYVNGVPTIYDSKYVVFGGCDSVLYVVSLEDGKLLRSVEVEAPIAASVAVGDGVGYVGNMDRAVMAFDVGSGEVVWNYRNKSFPYFSSPALTEKYVLIGGRDKGLHCIKRISGKLEWRFAARGRIDSSPVVAGDKVVFGSMDGKLYVVSLKDGKEISSYEVGEAISCTPALAAGRIFVGCEDGKIYAFLTGNKK
jgi:outer membrane protein assembly factor BamB